MYGKDELMGMDARAFAGNFLWSTGPTPFSAVTPTRISTSRMRGCTVSVDGTDVVTAGRLIDL